MIQIYCINFDTTAAEAVRRLSGISVENDQGEGRYVVIRGMSPELNSFSLNGAMLAAPENNRAVLLDGLSTDLLSSITVSKTPTIDQDADSIGGRIDFTTLDPDIDGSYNRLKIESSWNELTENSNNPRMSFTTEEKYLLMLLIPLVLTTNQDKPYQTIMRQVLGGNQKTMCGL